MRWLKWIATWWLSITEWKNQNPQPQNPAFGFRCPYSWFVLHLHADSIHVVGKKNLDLNDLDGLGCDIAGSALVVAHKKYHLYFHLHIAVGSNLQQHFFDSWYHTHTLSNLRAVHGEGGSRNICYKNWPIDHVNAIMFTFLYKV